MPINKKTFSAFLGTECGVRGFSGIALLNLSAGKLIPLRDILTKTYLGNQNPDWPEYMSRTAELRADPIKFLPWAKSLAIFAFPLNRLPLNNCFFPQTDNPELSGLVAVMLNGVTELVMMKADVLNSFGNLKVSKNYRFKDAIIDYIPFEDHLVEPVYKTVKGWNNDIRDVLKTEEFPAELNDYISFIETETGVKITVVSLGPDRKQTIFRK